MGKSIALALVLVACGPKVEISDTGGDGDGDGDGDDPMLRARCEQGCERFDECGPPPAWDPGPDWECVPDCIELFESCLRPGIDYVACTQRVDCDEWRAILIDPRETSCAREFSVAAEACGL